MFSSIWYVTSRCDVWVARIGWGLKKQKQMDFYKYEIFIEIMVFWPIQGGTEHKSFNKYNGITLQISNFLMMKHKEYRFKVNAVQKSI